jgi:fatty-acyl-CoA synthase
MDIHNAFRHFLAPDYNFAKIWKDMSRCSDRGIYVYNEKLNNMIFRSYGEIYAAAIPVAARLSSLGFTHGERVLLSAKTNIYFIELWVACMMCGVVPVPLPSNETFFTDNAYATRIRDILPMFGKYFCYEIESETIRQVAAEKNVELSLFIIPDLFSDNDSFPISPDFCMNVPKPDDTAFIQFTSGSTMRPKGIMATYENMLANIYGMSERWQIEPGRTVFGSWLPLFHDMGLIGFFLESLFTLTDFVLIPPWLFAKRPLYFMELLSNFKVELCCMTNFALEIILRWYDPDKMYDFALGRLRWFGIGAEPVSVDTIDRFERAFKPYGLGYNVVSPCYGLAEATLGVSIADMDYGYRRSVNDGHLFPTVGKPLSNVEVKIANDEDDPAKKGVIMLRGASIVTHALIDGEKKRIVDDEGYCNTKDLGYFHEDQLVIMGRADNMFIVNGENMFPHEIEAAVFRSGILKQKRVACIAIPACDSETGKQKVVVAYESKRITEAEKIENEGKLRKLVMREIGIPIDVFLCLKPKSIPLTTSGKIRHKELSRLYREALLDENVEYAKAKNQDHVLIGS